MTHLTSPTHDVMMDVSMFAPLPLSACYFTSHNLMRIGQMAVGHCGGNMSAHTSPPCDAEALADIMPQRAHFRAGKRY